MATWAEIAERLNTRSCKRLVGRSRLSRPNRRKGCGWAAWTSSRLTWSDRGKSARRLRTARRLDLIDLERTVVLSVVVKLQLLVLTVVRRPPGWSGGGELCRGDKGGRGGGEEDPTGPRQLGEGVHAAYPVLKLQLLRLANKLVWIWSNTSTQREEVLP